MNNTPFLQQLVRHEPWRQGVGLPQNALDPTWEPSAGDALCDGQVDWEPGTRWWACQKCGYVGSAFTQMHKAAKSPLSFLLESLEFFQRKQRERDPALTPEKILGRMLFVAGVALRYAAVQSDLGRYIERMVTR